MLRWYFLDVKLASKYCCFCARSERFSWSRFSPFPVGISYSRELHIHIFSWHSRDRFLLLYFCCYRYISNPKSLISQRINKPFRATNGTCVHQSQPSYLFLISFFIHFFLSINIHPVPSLPPTGPPSPRAHRFVSQCKPSRKYTKYRIKGERASDQNK
ncbi:hypothetical protein DL98DRAFT_215294 [Cadophora sp. DSE1049]|nr:hypothetical protein DL98DRAFT_215294 [Cadophora sp. DSE1049]